MGMWMLREVPVAGGIGWEQQASMRTEEKKKEMPARNAG